MRVLLPACFRRRPRLLAAPLLFAAAAAAAHPKQDSLGEFIAHQHFRVELTGGTVGPDGVSRLTVVEDRARTVSVRVRCTGSDCLFLPRDDSIVNMSALMDIALSPAVAGAILDGNARVRWTPHGTNEQTYGSGTVTISVADNNVADGDRTVTVSATGPYVAHYQDTGRGSYWYDLVDSAQDLEVQSAELTIQDSETQTLGLSLTDTNGNAVTSINEGESATVRVSRTGTSGAVTVGLSVTAGTGATASDFSLSSESLTIGAGATSATATITANDDDTDGSETKVVTLAATTATTGYRDAADVELAITDYVASAQMVDDAPEAEPMVDDAPGAEPAAQDNEMASVSLALAPERVAEGATARVSAVLTRPARTALTLTVSAVPGGGGQNRVSAWARSGRCRWRRGRGRARARWRFWRWTTRWTRRTGR